MALCSLFTWKGPVSLFLPTFAYSAWSTGKLEQSDEIIRECFEHATQPEDKGDVLRLRSRNHWLRNNHAQAFDDTLLALQILGIDINRSPTRRQADFMFEQVKNEIMAVGFDEILLIPRTTDKKTELAVTLLNDAGGFPRITLYKACQFL